MGEDPSEIGPREQITTLLGRVAAKEEGAPEALFDFVYTELHRRAAALMQDQPGKHTLQPTALVNELYLRLFEGEPGQWNDRAHFLRSASRAMRHILVDHARRRTSEKRGGGTTQTPLDEAFVAYEDRSISLIGLQEALLKLEQVDPVMATAVELRFFGGSSVKETAELIGVSLRTFTRRWKMTRAWLYREVR
ncbi:MAG: ECF-type sigma factor [Planctomycetota bacterium]